MERQVVTILAVMQVLFVDLSAASRVRIANMEEHVNGADLVNGSSKEFWSAYRYCIYCKGGRFIYVQRDESAWQDMKTALSVSEAGAHALVAIFPGTAVPYAIYHALNLGKKAVDFVNTVQDFYDRIMGIVPDEVDSVSIGINDNAPILDEDGSWTEPYLSQIRERGQPAYQREETIWIHLDGTGNADNESDTDPLLLLKKNYQSIWMMEADCWKTYSTWASCMATTDLGPNKMSPVMNELIDNHPALCGGKGGMVDHTKNPIILGMGEKLQDTGVWLESEKCLSRQFRP